MPSRAATAALLREQAAEPGRAWIRHVPVRWPGPPVPWLDLAAGRLGESNGDPDLLAALHGPRLADLLYLPPVPPALRAARDRLAARHAARGTPVLVQLVPGEQPPAELRERVVVVRDLLALALDEHADVAGTLTPAALAGGSAAAWPLIAGLHDAARLETVAAAVAAAGVPVLLAVPLELSGRDRRALGEAMPEERYLRLFHDEAPPPAVAARVAARHGLLPWLPRALPRPPLRAAANRRVAAALAACAELCLLLGEPESRAQALLRAARFAERSPHDLAALSREGNLAVLPWLEGEALELAAEAARGAEPQLWQQLLGRLAA